MNSSIQIKLGLSGLAQVNAGLSQVTSGIKSLLAPLAAGAAGFVSAKKIAEGLKDIVEFAGKFNDLSARTGTSIQRLIVQEQAMRDAGLGADALAHSYGKLQQALEDAFQGGGAQDAFRQLGLSAKDLMQLDPGSQFERVAKAIGELPTPTERTAAAMRIFGKGATELIPLFRDGGAFDSAAETLGEMPSLVARNAKVLDDLGDAFGRIPNKIRGLFIGVVDQLDGPIKELTEKINKIDLTKLGKKIGAFVQVAIDAWGDGRFDSFLSIVIGAGFEQGIAFAKSLMELNAAGIWKPIVTGLATGLMEVLKWFAQKATEAWAGLGIAMFEVISKVMPNGEDMLRMQKENGIKWAEETKQAWGTVFDDAIAKWKEFMGGTPGASNTPFTDTLKGLLDDAQNRRIGRGGGADVGVTTGSRTPDIDSISDQMLAMLRKLDEAFGTLAQKIARAFSTVINSAVDGVAGSIKGLLTLTMSWADALRNIGTSILTGVINSIAQMFAEWIVQMTLVRGLKRIFSAEDKVDAATTAAAWTPAAVVTNAATGGTTASIGVPLTLALILAAVAALSSLAFEHGGYTPGGPTLAMVGEKGPEFVIPAEATRRLGPQNLAMLHQGVIPSGGTGGGGNSVQINMGVFDDKQRMADFMRSSQGRKIFVDLAKQHAHEISR